MKKSTVAQTAFLLALTAGTGSATRYLTTVRNFGVKFKLHWWDNGRTEPYRMSFNKWGIYSAYTFNALGELQSILVDGEYQTFSTSRKLLATPEDIASRELLAMDEELEAEEMELEKDHHSRRLYECSDCENTWDTMCDTGLADVCGVVAWGGLTGNADAVVSLCCSKFTNECDAASGEEICADDCAEKIPEACDPNPCENEGECSADPAGGHVCSCASGYGGMACQTDTGLGLGRTHGRPFSNLLQTESSLWAVRVAFLESRTRTPNGLARWAEVITHVPCGGYWFLKPAGRVLITATLAEIDGVGGTLGSAGRTGYWASCQTISESGTMTFDIDDIDGLEDDGTFEGVILHEMGHVLGVGNTDKNISSSKDPKRNGDDAPQNGRRSGGNIAHPTSASSSAFAYECSTCSSDEDPAWLCPAALSAYYDLGGTDADILELGGGDGTSCGHLDEGIFDDELMTGYVDSTMYLSKMTAALLDDLDYIVDPSAVDPYTLPSERVASISAEDGPSIFINDTAVPAIIHAINDDGTFVEVEDILMVF